MVSAQKILVFRLSSLGDVALTVPVVMAVLEQNPAIYIDFVTPDFMHDLFPKHKRLTLIGFDKKAKHKGISGLFQLLNSLDLKNYDAIIDLHNVLRTKVLSTFSTLKRKKVIVINKDRKSRNLLLKGKINKPLKHATEKYADVFRKLGLKVELNHVLTNFLFENKENSKIIGVAPFARHEGKMFPIKKMEKIVKELSKNNEVWIFGTKEEFKKIKSWEKFTNLKFIKSDNLHTELKEMSRVKVMITMDSANMHLASLVGVPVISLWGVTHPNAGFLGYGQGIENVIQDESLSWRPSSIYGNKLGPKNNPTGFENITVKMVLYKIDSI